MKRLALLALIVPCIASAELTPPDGGFDSRIRIVDYNPADVVRLSTFYGVSTHIQFSSSETIKDVAIGDEQAWSVAVRSPHLFIKPKATKADTNITVVTTRRTYHFALIVQPRSGKDGAAWKDPNLVFSLSFRYPEDELMQSVAASKAAEKHARSDAARSKLSSAIPQPVNEDYWVAGSEEVSPTAAHDDGRFVYLTFSNNRDMPAVYETDRDGKEALINTNVEGNVIVVQRLVGQLTLRKGEFSACVVNRSFDFDGGKDNVSGTVLPEVQRVIKETR